MCDQDDDVAKAPSIQHRNENELTMMALPRGMPGQVASTVTVLFGVTGGHELNPSEDELPHMI
jgi:hypothetical protein